MERVLREVDNFPVYTWTSPTRKSILVITEMRQVTLSKKSCMVTALRAETACLPWATTMKRAEARVFERNFWETEWPKALLR